MQLRVFLTMLLTLMVWTTTSAQNTAINDSILPVVTDRICSVSMICRELRPCQLA